MVVEMWNSFDDNKKTLEIAEAYENVLSYYNSNK